MYLFRVKGFAVVIFLFLGVVCNAQTSTVSNPNSERENNPYSKYGIGELWNGNNTALKGMGNITSAFQDPYLINTDNPASYSAIQFTTFEGGMIGSTRTVTSATGESYSTGTASLAHISLAFPINNRAGISFGMKPYTHTYYALIDTSNTGIGQTVRSYAGDGGLTYAYIGGAYKFKGLSIGANVGYMFGTLRNFVTVVSIDTQVVNRAYESQFARYTKVGGIYWKAGFMYEHALADTEYSFRLGGTFTMSQSLSQKLNYYQISIYNFGDTIVNDTSAKNENQKGNLTLPMSASIGFMFSRANKWGIGADFQYSNWSNFHSSADTSMNYGVGTKSYKLAVGGEYTPNAEDINGYFSRVTYRMGLYYGTDYLLLHNTQLPFYGLTVGGSFPYRRSARTHSRLHMAMDIGRMGTTANSQLQETYFRVSLGLSFNDRWFVKAKYD